ncbi:MAG TPA: hypothetical protein PKH77_21265 [Anaerolineae bacterium]|nr:hypothetical protein [Anaerolineae bacterium]
MDSETLLAENTTLAARVRELEQELRIARETLETLTNVGQMVGRWSADEARRALQRMAALHPPTPAAPPFNEGLP